MVSERRHKRIEGEILKIAAMTIETLKDPALRMITVTRVEITDDLKLAAVYYVSLKKSNYVQEHLNKVRGIVRNKIGKDLNLRYTPDIKFEYDKGLDYQMSMENIFKQIKNEESFRKDS